VQKTDQDRARILHAVQTLLLFRTLDSDQIATIVDAMTYVRVARNTCLTREGDSDPVGIFYVVAEGTYDSYTNGQKTATFGPGNAFGEQALLHSMAHPATVIATSAQAALWTIDRLTFRSLLAHSTQCRRTRLLDLLARVPFLKPLTLHELQKLLDGLQTQYFSPGQVIVKEGETDHSYLYLIEEGKAFGYRQGTLVEEYNAGKERNYFCELSFLHQESCHETIVAENKADARRLKVVALESGAFARLLGSVQDVLSVHRPDLPSPSLSSSTPSTSSAPIHPSD
ncbi:cyclic nucleotide-binding-like protein, partial [Syncephalastrum racemosum]